MPPTSPTSTGPRCWTGTWPAARLDQGLSQAPDTGGPNRHTCWLATINPATALLTVAPGGATRWRF